MKPTVLGISASPHKDGKVERLMTEMLEATRLPYELLRLHEIRVWPCIACNACRKDNICVLKDDWNEVSQKILKTRVLVLGAWGFSGMIDSATKALMERFWSFRHHHQLTKGKIGAVVMAGANPNLMENLSEALLQFMRNYSIIGLGKVTAIGTNPCLGCEDAIDACEYSNVVAQYGRLGRLGTGMYNPIENQLEALRDARIMGQRLEHKLKHMKARGIENNGL
jgi:multimeric flavodoxin WrbA